MKDYNAEGILALDELFVICIWPKWDGFNGFVVQILADQTLDNKVFSSGTEVKDKYPITILSMVLLDA